MRRAPTRDLSGVGSTCRPVISTGNPSTRRNVRLPVVKARPGSTALACRADAARAGVAFLGAGRCWDCFVAGFVLMNTF